MSDQTLPQLKNLLQALARWLSVHADVTRAYLTRGEDDLLFLLVSSRQGSRAFQHEVRELERQVASSADYCQLRMTVLALPVVSEDHLDHYIHPSFAARLL